ncbi:hypothetical protein IT400_04315 [Candidatus Nomurabacteria bacterium]|nr:hypothetical protein [Candidatus Nomurabacteria bacterium]
MKKEVKKSKKMTIDDLAIMVAKGFNGIESRMVTKEEMNARFREVDERFDKVDEGLDKIESRLDNIETNDGKRLDKLEDKTRIIYTAFEKQLKIKLAK